ncbi:hydroxyisourate hydrolase [Acinetobacter bereziniae]|uniref:hydroxyisourate hydrolase n=2 Tax=Acinetobacter bereziniae TaxID=106648 RepID=UPI001580C712|nr:hydroxyisourate hydrolase [Acinetobacter bereziniae]NUF64233.1 hydroxyisourate hydrolase [Acinetobacter bereziniae]NUG65010.1 hydroxyisourate hydrolase [Acinetobacter bereziniae]NUG70676.1 hydroxyisourate hydrolase [Acinetobacter bereziniae]
MISSHILDTHLGKPATDVVIKLFDAQEQLIAESKTNNDGRVADFNLSEIQTGQYRLVFYTADYFNRFDLNTFFPKVVIDFFVNDINQHYHIPLLISPFAYSTYRGS